MEQSKVLSSLCYFSVFFAPFILPIVMYFVANDPFVRHHAKRSLLSHVIPFLIMIGAFVIFAISAISTSSFASSSGGFDIFMAGTPFIIMIVYFIISMFVLVWNVIQGIKVLQQV